MSKLFKSAIIVTFFSVATRALGFVLRIVLSRALGAEMLGNYQVAMSIFGVLMTLVASGLPLVISRSVSYNKSIGEDKKAYGSVSAGLIIALSISCIVSLLIYLFPNILNLMFTQNDATAIIMYMLPGLIASAIYCVLRSALWGEKHFFAISFTEFFEQVVRIILCFVLFIPTILPSVSLGEKAGLSLTIACICSCILVVFIYFALKQKLTSPKIHFKPLLKSSVPITTLRSVSSIVTSLIALIIPARLMLYGYTSSQAMAEFGIVMGMSFPLIMIPGTLISSLAVTLVPEISSKTDNIDDLSHTHDLNGLKSHINLGLNMSILISCILIPAFIVLGKPICEILFNSPQAGTYVSVASIIMLPMGINQITGSILNSIGLEFKSLINYAISATALFLSIFFLPKYLGTYALIIGMGSLSLISSILNLRMLKKRNLLDKKYIKNIVLCLVFTCISSVVGFLLKNLFTLFLPTFISTVFLGVIITAIMCLLILSFNISGIKGFVLLKKRTK